MPLVLRQLQRPAAERERVVGLQSQYAACGRGDGTAGPDISRTNSDQGIPQTKTADVNERTGDPVPTREDRGMRRNGPRRRAARFRVPSSELIGARNGPRELEFQGASARRLVECRSVWIALRCCHFKPEIYLQAHFFGTALGNGVLEVGAADGSERSPPRFRAGKDRKKKHHKKTPDDHPKDFACAAVLSASTKPQKTTFLKKICFPLITETVCPYI